MLHVEHFSIIPVKLCESIPFPLSSDLMTIFALSRGSAGGRASWFGEGGEPETFCLLLVLRQVFGLAFVYGWSIMNDYQLNKNKIF